MVQTLGYYNPQFYASEALIYLKKALGMAGRIHTGYDKERKAFGKGDTINISGPSSFTVQDAPSTAQDLNPQQLQLTLSFWKEVKFKLTDRELTFTTEKIINDHISPAAYALADYVDQQLASLYKDVPFAINLNGTITVADATNVYQKLFDNLVPMGDPTKLHYMICGAVQNGFQQLAAFTQWQGSGALGVESQLRGTLGTRYGMEFFANQNTPTHVSGTPALTSPVATGTQAVGATSLIIGGSGGSGTIKKGDIITFTGVTQAFAVTADTVIAAGGATITVTPAVPVAITGATVAVFDIQGGTGTSKVNNLAFHRNAFAMAMAPLTEIGKELGAKVATIYDEITGLAIRARLYYVGNSSEVHVALDILFGIKTLNGNLAVRARS